MFSRFRALAQRGHNGGSRFCAIVARGFADAAPGALPGGAERAPEGRITAESMDPRTLVAHNITSATEERMRDVLRSAGVNPGDYGL